MIDSIISECIDNFINESTMNVAEQTQLGENASEFYDALKSLQPIMDAMHEQYKNYPLKFKNNFFNVKNDYESLLMNSRNFAEINKAAINLHKEKHPENI